MVGIHISDKNLNICKKTQFWFTQTQSLADILIHLREKFTIEHKQYKTINETIQLNVYKCYNRK